MIAKGNTHDNGARLARYIVTGKEGELAELWDLRGFASRDITDAFRSVHVTASKSQCMQPFFHVQLRNPEGERLTRAQWNSATDKIEGMLGLCHQPRAMAVHIDRESGHEHVHVAWSRIDPETLKAKPLPFFKLRLKKACRELESSLRLTPVSSDRKSSISYAPKRGEEQQAIRLGVALKDVRENIRAAFERSDCGRSFQLALADEGLILARGDRRDFMVIDCAGGIHAIGKRILGTSAAEVRARLSDLSRDQLPTVEIARQSLRGPQTSHTPVIATPLLQGPTRPVVEEAIQHTTTYLLKSQASPCKDLPDFVLTPEPDPAATPTSETVGDQLKTPDITPNEDRARGFASSLKRQFRAAVKALLKRAPPPKPQLRRKRNGETIGSFRLVARNILRPIIRLPPVSRAVGFLNDTLPWLHLWEWNDIDDYDGANADGNREDNRLSPHP
jgi:hypothetical protein